MVKSFGKEKTHLLTNAIDFDRLQLFSDNNTSNQVLIFGTDFYRKGVDLAIKAILKLDDSSNLNLLVVTHTPEKTIQLIKSEIGYLPNFVTVTKPTQNVASLYNQSFLFLSPSRSEAFGYANIEAAYCGCQVIAIDVPGQNTTKNTTNINWVEKDDVQGLSEAIFKAYLNRKHVATLIEKNRKDI